MVKLCVLMVSFFPPDQKLVITAFASDEIHLWHNGFQDRISPGVVFAGPARALVPMLAARHGCTIVIGGKI